MYFSTIILSKYENRKYNANYIPEVSLIITI